MSRKPTSHHPDVGIGLQHECCLDEQQLLAFSTSGHVILKNRTTFFLAEVTDRLLAKTTCAAVTRGNVRAPNAKL